MSSPSDPKDPSQKLPARIGDVSRRQFVRRIVGTTGAVIPGLGVLGGGLGASGVVQAESLTVEIPALADTTIDQTQPSSNFGAAQTLVVGTNGEGQEAHALIRFDAKAVEKEVQKQSGPYAVHLVLMVSEVSAWAAGLQVLDAHGFDGAFSEAGATWDDPQGRETGLSTFGATSPGAAQFLTWDVTTDVLMGVVGWRLRLGRPDQAGLVSLYSRNSPLPPAMQPMLRVVPAGDDLQAAKTAEDESVQSMITSQTPTPTVSVTPSPTPTRSMTPTPSRSATPSPTPTRSMTPTPSRSATPSPTPTRSMTPTPSTSVSPTPTPSPLPPTPTPSPSISISPSPSPSPSLSPTPTPSPSTSITPTPTPSISVSPTPTPSPSISVSPTPTPSPSASITPTPTPTASVTPTPTPTASPTPTPTPTPSPSPKPGRRVGPPPGVPGKPDGVPGPPDTRPVGPPPGKGKGPGGF